MIKSKTFIIGIIILTIIVLGGSYFLLRWNSQVITILPSGGEKKTVMPKATGSITDLEASIEEAIADENSLYNEENYDANMGLQDDIEISDFGQIVNENEI